MFVFYLTLIVTVVVHTNSSLDSCRQQFGKHHYDLNQLSDLTIFGSDDTFKYAFTPCGLVPTNQCGKNTGQFEPGMTACQERVSGSQFESSMGFLDGYNKLPNLEFSENPQGPGTGIVMTIRNAKCNFRERLVSVTFICDKNVKKPISMDVIEKPVCQFSITVKASAACPLEKGMAGGAIFLIIFFVAIISYLIGGISYNRFRRNEAGVKLLPHRSFWLLTVGYFVDGWKATWTFVNAHVRLPSSSSSSSTTKYESV